jgi:tRNA threonylcarbamoyladenosine biosynthesis protein TsaB
MKILAIETASDACSVALTNGTDLDERYSLEPRRHTRLILPMIDEILAAHQLSVTQLDAVAFGRGPGAFTGVRVAASVAQGIAFGADLPAIPVSTLAALAQQGCRESGRSHYLVAVDARINEVYWASYHIEAGLAVLNGAEQVLGPDAVPLPDESGWCGIGTGWAVYREALLKRLSVHVDDTMADALPRACDVAFLAMDRFRAGDTVSAEDILPVYLRDRVVS